MYYIDGSGSFNEQYGRRLLEGIKSIINKYVIFTNEESAEETQILVSMALYFECLGFQNIVNRNIPNSLEYREEVIPESQWEELIKNEIPKQTQENRFRKFIRDNLEDEEYEKICGKEEKMMPYCIAAVDKIKEVIWYV